jgi:hypothetical protein
MDSALPAFQGQAVLSTRKAACSNCYMWISDPITTVRDGHKLPKAAATTRDSCAAWKWFTESSRGSSVVLGNRPYSVSRTLRAEEIDGINMGLVE